MHQTRQPTAFRILRLTPWFYWPPPTKKGWPLRFNPVGGMANQIYQISRELAASGVEQVILTLGMKGAPRRWLPYDRTTVYAVRVPWPPLRSSVTGTVGLVASWAIGVILWSLWHVLRGGRSDIDVIHCHLDDSVWAPLVGLAATYLYRKPLLVTVNSSRLAPASTVSSYSKTADRAELLVLRRAALVHVITRRTGDFYLRRGYVRPDQLVVIGDVVDCTAFEEAGRPDKVAAFKHRFGLPHDKKLIVYASRISYEKGWEYYIEAACKLQARPDIHFLVASGGLQQKDMEHMIAARGLQDRFTITGYLPHSEMPAALATADIFVLPSKVEELGSVCLEAMAVGCPIVAADVGGIAEAIGHASAGILVTPHSGEALASGIADLLDDEERIRDYGKRGREHVRLTYDINRCAAEYYAVYQRFGFRPSQPG